MAERDDPLEVLFRPWRAEPPTLDASDRVLFLGARPHPDLSLADPATVVAVQPWQPAADGLKAMGLTVLPDDRAVGDGYASVLVLPERQRDGARAWLGRAVLAAREGGEVIACAPTREGGQRLGDELAELLGEVTIDVKARCRVVRGVRGPDADLELAASWADQDRVRDVWRGMSSRPGLFAWDHVDEGSARLVECLPNDLGGVVADVGCGWGYLSAAVLARGVRPTELHLIEADARGLAIAKANLAPHAAGVALHSHWIDATTKWPVPALDAIVCNPPFHERGETSTELGRGILRSAFEALKVGGSLWMVANRHLPYEKTLYQTFGAWDVLDERGGYKVIRATRRKG
jgi:16S rRNA (guanine1207-N2)-methyltransferase